MIILAVIVSLQIDTKNILFICGGAFIDLEKTISERLVNIETRFCSISFLDSKGIVITCNCFAST